MDAADLLERVRAEPWDDRPRHVLADWLEEHGDPRGAFISLQLARRERVLTTRERRQEFELLAQHGPAWLHPIGPLLLAPVFERGFLAAATVLEIPAWSVGDPLWATVERLTVTSDSPAVAALLHHPVMRGLSLVSGLGPAAIERLGPTFRAPTLELFQPSRRTLQLLSSLASVKELRLGESSAASIVALLQGPLRGTLERLTAEVSHWELCWTWKAGELALEARSNRGRAEGLAAFLETAGLPRPSSITVAAKKKVAATLERLLAGRGATLRFTPLPGRG